MIAEVDSGTFATQIKKIHLTTNLAFPPPIFLAALAYKRVFFGKYAGYQFICIFAAVLKNNAYDLFRQLSHILS